MKRRIVILGTLLVLAFGATQLFAHVAFRVVGKISAWKEPRLEVKTKEGNEVAIILFSTTDIFRNKKKADRSELKVGRSVVVDALGDDISDLEGVKVDIR